MRNKELLNDLLALIRHIAKTPITDFGANPKVVPQQGRKLRMLRRKQKTALLMSAVRRHIAEKKEISRLL